MKRIWLMLWLLLLLGALAAESDFAREYRLAQGVRAQEELIQGYLKKELSLDALREIQSAWQMLQPAAMQAYFDSLAIANPNNPAYQYLSQRYREAADTLPHLRQIVSLAPDFYWNTRLYALNLCESYHTQLSEVFTEADERLLIQASQHFPTDAYLKIALFYLYQTRGEPSHAASSLAGIADAAVLAANWQSIELFLLSEKNIALFDALSATLWQDELGAGNISAEEHQYLQDLAHEEFLKKMALHDAQESGADK